MPEGNNAERLKAQAASSRKYAFFRFQTGRLLASACGCCFGQVDRKTGEILANITYGLFQYREVLKLNISDPVNSFPYTIEDEIICAAKKSRAVRRSHDTEKSHFRPEGRTKIHNRGVQWR